MLDGADSGVRSPTSAIVGALPNLLMSPRAKYEVLSLVVFIIDFSFTVYDMIGLWS